MSDLFICQRTASYKKTLSSRGKTLLTAESARALYGFLQGEPEAGNVPSVY